MENARLPPDDALTAAREAAVLHPQIAGLALAYGDALLEAGKLPEAIGELQRALRLDHHFAMARYRLGCAWLEAGEPGKALEAFARLDDGYHGVAEQLARIEAMKGLARSDAGYVRHLFDQFAADYDARMIGQLNYRAPQILRALADMVLPGRSGLDILDLGCGTGLTGAVFHDLARRLDGIDLSPDMLAKARERRIYGNLTLGDIEALGPGPDYDLLLAADTLVYLGDLTPVFKDAAARLRPGGVFLFTAEQKEGEGFELGPKRRWRHAESYIRDQAASAGFETDGFLACAPRFEANVPVDGFAVALSKRN